MHGWKLAEAVRRTSDLAALKEAISKRRKWRKAGWPIYITCRAADGRTPDPDPADGAWKAFEVAREPRLRDLLARGRLIAWGRRESAVADLKPIPPSAWDHLRIKDFKRSIVRERQMAKSRIFDLRIFPVVHAPDAVDHLADMPLIDAFRQFVFDDPQVAALHAFARARGGQPFEVNFQRGLYEAIWPADFGRGPPSDLLLLMLDRVQCGRFGSRSFCRLATVVLGRRFAALIGALASGELAASGVTQTGQNEVIPRSLWLRDRTRLDLHNGDLLEDLQDNNSDDSYSQPDLSGAHAP